MHVHRQAWLRFALLVLLGWQTAGISFGQAGVPDPTQPGGSTTSPGSSTATNWLRLNGNVGINTADPKARLQVYGGDVYVETIGSGVILKSPNGYCWRLTIDNGGNFVRTRIPCPGEGPLPILSVTLQPGPSDGQDGYTSTSSTTALGGGAGMAVGAWTTNGNPTTYQSYLRFDVSAIPTTAKIDSAFLTLAFYTGWFSEPNIGNNSAYLQRVTSAWNPATLNYDTRPGSTTVGQLAVPAAESQPGVYQKLDVKSLVADMVANPAANFGLLLRLQNEAIAPPYRLLLFATSEHPTPANRPKLVVFYSL